MVAFLFKWSLPKTRLLIFNTLYLLQERKANFHMRDVSLQWSDYTRQNLISLVLIFHFQEFDFTTKFLKQLSWGVLKQLYTTLWKTATSLKNTCGVVSHGLRVFKVTKKEPASRPWNLFWHLLYRLRTLSLPAPWYEYNLNS